MARPPKSTPIGSAAPRGRDSDKLEEQIRLGLDQLDRGERVPAEEVFEELQRRRKQRREKRS